MQHSITSGTHIGALGTACPPCSISQTTADRLLTEHYAHELSPRAADIMHRVLQHPGIKNRFVAVDRPEDLLLLKNEDPDKRMDRFTRWAVNLSCQAITEACSKADIRPTDIDYLIVNTCTGYICPGISTYIAESLQLSQYIKTYDLVGAGCGGALPNLQLADALLAQAPESIVVSVAVEICTATFQMGNDLSLIISNALFGDGAAAAVLWRKQSGPAIIDSFSELFPEHRESVRYVYRQGNLHNQLSADLPELSAKHVASALSRFLETHSMTPKKIAHWAIHPGGSSILDRLQQVLLLSDTQLAASRLILSNYGNMSSPTVLFVLQHLISSTIPRGEPGLIVGFGAGFSIYGTLITW